MNVAWNGASQFLCGSLGELAFYYVFPFFFWWVGGVSLFGKKETTRASRDGGFFRSYLVISIKIGKRVLLRNDCLNLNLEINLHNQEVCLGHVRFHV